MSYYYVIDDPPCVYIFVLASQVIRGEIELSVCERKFLNAATQMVFTFRRVRIELKGEYRVERWK